MRASVQRDIRWMCEDKNSENSGLPWDSARGAPSQTCTYPGLAQEPFILPMSRNNIFYLVATDHAALMEWMLAHGYITEQDMAEYTLSLMQDGADEQ